MRYSGHARRRTPPGRGHRLLFHPGARDAADAESPYETACASYEPPIADTLLGAAAMGTAVYTSTRCTPNGLDCLGDGMTAGMLVSSGIILAASATYGYIQKARCERARPPAAYDAAVARSSDSSE